MDNRSILILYGTETGNAKDASEKIGRLARRHRFSARVVAMDAFLVVGYLISSTKLLSTRFLKVANAYR
jgi:sulfite reductase alpha subunit-like flavoprotein